jgi:hypothetical protein
VLGEPMVCLLLSRSALLLPIVPAPFYALNDFSVLVIGRIELGPSGLLIDEDDGAIFLTVVVRLSPPPMPPDLPSDYEGRVASPDDGLANFELSSGWAVLFCLFVSGPPLLVTGTPLTPSILADPRFSKFGAFLSFPKSLTTPLEVLGACVKLCELSRFFLRVGAPIAPFTFAALPPMAFSLPLATDILSVPFFSTVVCFLAVVCG